jgi:hypothetical protein
MYDGDDDDADDDTDDDDDDDDDDDAVLALLLFSLHLLTYMTQVVLTFLPSSALTRSQQTTNQPTHPFNHSFIHSDRQQPGHRGGLQPQQLDLQEAHGPHHMRETLHRGLVASVRVLLYYSSSFFSCL